jgi:glycosyltransferase involved in cell wall biosynthesis/predicted deacetylase
MLVRIDNFPHGDLLVHHQLAGSSHYDHREYIYRFLKPFEDNQIPYVLGVSPGLIDSDSDIFFLRSLRYCEVAMHGYSHGWHEFSHNWTHVGTSLKNGGEFANLSSESIRNKINRGLEILAEFKISKFIAPFNVYTQALLDVLNELDFDTIMSGREALQYGMHKLDHGGLTLDVCLPPFVNRSDKLVPVLRNAIKEQKTITLQWIYESPDYIPNWTRIADTIKESDSGLQNSFAHVFDAIQNCSSNSRQALETDLPDNLPIAIVTETMNYVSGGVRCIAEVLNRLKRRGLETACFVTHPDLNCEWLNIEFPILPVSQFQDFSGIAISPYSPTAEIVARSNALAKFYWVHSYEPKFPELTGRSDSWRMMSETSYRFDELYYIAVSSYVKMILELIYRRNVASQLVPGGVDTTLFKPGTRPKGRLRVMFLSREHAFRGANDIIDALHRIWDRGSQLDVCVMGSPIDMGGIPHQFFPSLPQREFAQLLGSADIFIHASHFEGFGLPPLEAMACGCAVIATYVGASDYLLDGHNALVIPPRKPDKIASALQRLISNPGLRFKLAQGGLQTVRNGYTWDHTVDRLEAALIEGLRHQECHAVIEPAPSIAIKQRTQTVTPKLQNITVSNNPSDRDRAVGQLRLPKYQHDAMDAAENLWSQDRSDSCDGHFTVSAIVSTYNAERFIGGCLTDLISQTISDQVEIIVVDCGSEQDEESIVREFQKNHGNIKYIKTSHRESVYSAWNRGVRVAGGRYITNANTDDRHAPHAFERMAKILDSSPDIALIYADLWITETENETFDRFTPVGKFVWREFDPATLIKGCYIGPQPMWRKDLHEKYGYFDESFESAGDWDFWLRISRRERFLHLNEVLGLYLRSPQSIEHRDQKLSLAEFRIIQQRFAHQGGQAATGTAPFSQIDCA